MFKKITRLIILLLILVPSLMSDYVRRGAIMCNNYDSAYKLNELDGAEFWNYWDKVSNVRICAMVEVRMNIEPEDKVSLNGGVTKVNIMGRDIYFLTEEIRK